MGAALSSANGEANAANQELDTLIHVLQNKRDEFLLKVKSTRGAGTDVTREVQGGRSVMRTSDIRVCVDEKNNGIDCCIADFFKHAQGGDCGKRCAVEGCKHLISSHLDSLFSCSAGTGMEKEGFVILFLNFSFVRVDYYVYTYAVSGANRWGEKNKSGTCYVADIAVLDPCSDLRPGEIDYLLGQALYLPSPSHCTDETEREYRQQEFYAVMKLKIQLVQSVVLSRLLSKCNVTMDEIQCATEKLIETQEVINHEFSKLGDVNIVF